MMQGLALLLTFYLTVQLVLANSPPTFLLPSSGFGLSQDVSEDTTTGNSVYTLLGQDADAEALTYAIKTQTPTSPAFSLVSSELRAPSGLDAETTQAFTFVFTVSDAASSVDSETFTVNILDVNEFDPVFSGAPYSGSVVEGAAVGTTVVTVAATDQDVTSTLTYSITAGNTPSTFAIDSAGAVTVSNSANVDPATTPSYTLTVRASDGTRNADTTVTITVTADPCNPNPCQNSGTCTATGATANCACTSGYTGNTCDTDDLCFVTPCHNNGTCSQNGSTYHCVCTDGYTGDTCSIVDLCFAIPCENNGTCSQNGDTFHCACADGYTGETCSIEASAGNSSERGSPEISDGAIAGIVVGSVFLVGVGVTGAAVAVKKSKTQVAATKEDLSTVESAQKYSETKSTELNRPLTDEAEISSNGVVK